MAPRPPPVEPRECAHCLRAFTPADPRRVTCSGACRTARNRRIQASDVENRRIWVKEATRMLEITDREARYWLKKYITGNRERCWGRPQVSFADLFWLAYMAKSRKAGIGTLTAARGLERLRKTVLRGWTTPLSQTVLCEAKGVTLLVSGRSAFEVPSPAVLVDGPHLVRSVLMRHKKRVKVGDVEGGRTRVRPD